MHSAVVSQIDPLNGDAGGIDKRVGQGVGDTHGREYGAVVVGVTMDVENRDAATQRGLDRLDGVCVVRRGDGEVGDCLERE